MRLTGKAQSDLNLFSKKSTLAHPGKPPRAWIIVIDRHIAHIFEKNESGGSHENQ